MTNEKRGRPKKDRKLDEQVGWMLGKTYGFLRSSRRKLHETELVKDIKHSFQEGLEEASDQEQSKGSEDK